ncbi:cache domain-containing sensor histidine kinase [Paenibacillus eucommiae]|uniref:histidine kinase n=1 Tax=Paenibacillus eucommiae TaxID=1355755 RepID=A0ABS4INK7_9BACL|nr:sensor histidine kinase [Paenibacillus eucommiae]MBP1989145.1 sensor histidine kinase YesM [Paenibacillus eucommiae]
MINSRKVFNSMFVRLFLTLALASLLVFSGLLYSALSSSREALSKQKSADMTIFIERTGQYLELYLQNIRNILINASADIDDTLLKDPKKLENMLRGNIEQNSSIISHMFVLREDGSVVSSNQLIYDVVGHPELPKIARIAHENRGLVNWSEPYYTPLQVGQTIAFALALKGGDGILLVEINTNQLTKRLNEMLYSSGQGFTLFTNQGHIVSYNPYSSIVPYKHATLPPEMEDSFTNALTQLPNGVSRIEGADGPLMAVKSKRYELGWYLVTLTDERKFNEAGQSLVVRFLTIGALWFSLLIVLTLGISRYFTIPINRLALQMDRVRGERLAVPPRQIERKDEIGRLSLSFYTMMGRIQELLQTVKENEERKKEIELLLLINQIRPHFLYNTLACIGSLAKQHRVQEVEETIRSLIQLLSYSIGKTDNATLEEEFLALRSYVQIQKIRYGEAFNYVEELGAEFAQITVPKLILQPLLENSIFHGLAVKGEGTVWIRARAEEGKLLLTVRDDGQGMTDTQIKQTLMALAPSEQTDLSNLPAGVRQGIGLSNVQERIRIHYGQEYGLEIRSEPGLWTEVVISLPLP